MIKLYYIIFFILFSNVLIASENKIKEDSVLFHIRIEAYRDIPDSIQELLTINHFDTLLITSGTDIIYTVHSKEGVGCYDSALEKKQEYVEKGYKYAFIIAFDREKRITIPEAIKRTKDKCEK